jgi:tetratricopeptide (TPR) repeat protein
MKNRSLWQILAFYAASSWVVLQVVDVVKDNLGLPDWVFPFAMLLLLIGLPIIVATAVVQGRHAAAAADVAADDPASAKRPHSPATEAEPSTRRLLTWRNALVGGALAFMLLAVVTTGFMFMRNRGIGPVGSLVAKGMLEEQAAIVVADFVADDPSLARAVTQAFRVDLSQSERVKVVEPATLDEALARMELPEDQAITHEVAHELAVREGYPAVIEGEVSSIGDGYVLTARLADARSEETLASLRETAADANEVIPAIDRLSGKMRERIGDSYTDMRADAPLANVTTGSLEALEKYSQALELFRAGRDRQLGVELLEEAVAIDTAFAMAWRKIGVETVGDQARTIEAMEKAYRFRDRLTERESLLAEASYYTTATGEPHKAIRVYERMVELDPRDAWALNNLGAAYTDLAEWAEAEHWFSRSVAIDSSVKSIINVATAQLNQGNLEEAEATVDIADRLAPGGERGLATRYSLEMNRENWSAAATLAAQLRDENTDAAWTSVGSYELGNVAAIQGKLAEAERHWREAARASDEAGDAFPAWPIMQVFDLDIHVRRDTAQALRTLDAILEEYPLESMDVMNRPYGWLAFWHARAGNRVAVEALLATWEAEVPPEYRSGEGVDDWMRSMEVAHLMSEGRFEAALDLVRQVDLPGCMECRYVPKAQIFDQLGARDSALAMYTGYLELYAHDRAGWDNELRGPSLERVGQLYDEAGDLENAAVYYARFVELWADADPELQPRVEAARARLEEIIRERG